MPSPETLLSVQTPFWSPFVPFKMRSGKNSDHWSGESSLL